MGLIILLLTALMAACGGGGEPRAEEVTTVATPEDAVAASVRQTMAAIAVEQTVAALTTGTAPPAGTEIAELPNPTATSAFAQATPTTSSPTATNAPPAATNPPPTATLAPTVSIPTPTPPVPSATRPPPPPPVGSDKPNAGTCVPGEDVQNIISDITLDPNYLFRVTAFDNRVGTNDGDGIDTVDFTIFSNATGDTVYQNTEQNPAYCIFQGGEPNCNPWSLDALGQYHWGNNGPVVEAGEYFVLITLRWDENRPDELSGQSECNWNSGDTPLIISFP
jgi:hypothetical protein